MQDMHATQETHATSGSTAAAATTAATKGSQRTYMLFLHTHTLTLTPTHECNSQLCSCAAELRPGRKLRINIAANNTTTTIIIVLVRARARFANRDLEPACECAMCMLYTQAHASFSTLHVQYICTYMVYSCTNAKRNTL